MNFWKALEITSCNLGTCLLMRQAGGKRFSSSIISWMMILSAHPVARPKITPWRILFAPIWLTRQIAGVTYIAQAREGARGLRRETQIAGVTYIAQAREGAR